MLLLNTPFRYSPLTSRILHVS
uniref:Uncharacterized protein n=1 Tax=Anguilla anguilla TaxID=7936 RepID=A0A0E9THM2_ANGAN